MNLNELAAKLLIAHVRKYGLTNETACKRAARAAYAYAEALEAEGVKIGVRNPESLDGVRPREPLEEA